MLYSPWAVSLRLSIASVSVISIASISFAKTRPCKDFMQASIFLGSINPTLSNSAFIEISNAFVYLVISASGTFFARASFANAFIMCIKAPFLAS